MEETIYSFGMIGLGTMGRSLLLNMADRGFSVAGYDKNPDQLKLLETEAEEKPIKPFADLNEFVQHLQKKELSR